MMRFGNLTLGDPYRLINGRQRKRAPPMFKCSTCNFQSRNKSFLFHHEKTAHMKKRIYRCLECGYVTNEKGRYLKHIKYHSLPKMQCDHCFFRTAYKWNMDRHMKNHEEGAQGAFRCDKCNFTTSTKQSYKSHVTHHHNSSANDLVDPDDEDLTESPNMSSEWEDIDEGNNDETDLHLANGNEDNYEYLGSAEDNNQEWYNEGTSYQKTLECKICPFKTTWPFELKKHEDTHKSQKKHNCQICGMRFEHMAWLIKHLRRIHSENPQAKNLAATYDLMKPGRKKFESTNSMDSVLPMYRNIVKPTNIMQRQLPNSNSDPNRGSMLSVLLNKPLVPILPKPSNPYSTMLYKSKAQAAATNMSRHLRVSTFSDRMQNYSSPAAPKIKNVPTCNVCGYKTRWISELQRHMRVHSHEKPFQCPKCKYHCKWKGDLNRHLMKYHGIKVPSAPKGFLAQKKLPQTSGGEVSRNLFGAATLRNPDQDGPLDLTKDSPPKDTLMNNGNQSDYELEFPDSLNASKESVIDVESISKVDDDPSFQDDEASTEDSTPSSTKRKYQCPFCSFSTTTASRFHVHVVQHYNRRPFMCSVCGYNSNWEWDITKHIKLKNCRDQLRNKACVLLTDESGRRNYDKYEKYLVDIDQPAPAVPPLTVPEKPEPTAVHRPSNSVSPSKACSYDFRSIGSNFEDTPESIVVTPDIGIPDNLENSEVADYYNAPSYEKQSTEENSFVKGQDSKCFYCYHCNFRHATKRVVVSHLSIHAGIKPFRCRACGIMSNWRHVIVRHVKDIHDGYMNQVEDRISYIQEGFCIKLTDIDSNGGGNEKSQPHVALFGCKICPYKCDKEFYMKFHMKQHRPREGAIYRCDFCPYFVKFKKTLVRHMKLHSLPQKCEENFALADEGPNDTDNYELQDHLMISDENSEMIYEQQTDVDPDSIAISFDTLNQFTNCDSVSPSKIKRHICECCPYRTDNKTQYLYHKQFHRPNPTAPFKCAICTYWATMQHLMTQHMKVHSDADSEQEQGTPQKSLPPTPSKYIEDDIPTQPLPDNDDDCDRMSLVHVRRNGEVIKMFKCKFCPMMNRKRTNVRVHLKMHGVIVNEGKYACPHCDYQCLNQGGLTNHIKIHQKSEETYVEESYRKEVTEGSNTSQRRKIFSYFCLKCPALFKSVSDYESHSRFHGSSLPLPCNFCCYRARNRSHLVKHLGVHTPEYEAKRRDSHGPPPSQMQSSVPAQPEASKKIDQMLLLEGTEMSAALKKTGEAANHLLKCDFCPASFSKQSTLSYHVSLHSSDGIYKCSQCDYAVNRLQNLELHGRLHPKKSSTTSYAKPLIKKKYNMKTFPCSKCPSVLYKQDRYDRHQELHGKNYKFVCKYCDYSVNRAANLVKHERIHERCQPRVVTEAENVDPIPQNTTANLVGASYYQEPEKATYICDRCPYTQTRKDAIQAHQRRHWQGDGFQCPYCDYTSMQNGFIQSHIKLHIQPGHVFPPQAFMKFECFQIFINEDDKETLLFDDREGLIHNPENKKIENRVASPFEAANQDSTDKKKWPMVVLSDIMSNDKDLQKYAPQLKIPKLKISKSQDALEEKKYSKISILDNGVELQSTLSKPVPSLVVKISKIENGSNKETLYSVSTKTSDAPDHACDENASDVPETLTKFDSNNSSNVPISTSPVPVDSEESTVTSSSAVADLTTLEEMEVDDKTQSSDTCDSYPKILAEVTEAINNSKSEKVDDSMAISLNRELLLDNEDILMTNGLSHLPEEIKVGL